MQLTDKQIKTRKPHECYGCLKKFPSGTEMRLIVSVEKSSISSVYLCEDCDKHSQDWSDEEWKSTFPGDIGYWENDQWHPAN